MSHEAIFRWVYAQPVATLRRELIALRTGRTERRGPRPAPAPRIREPRYLVERPAEADGRAVPGHWEGDLVIGKGGKTAVATLVERTSRFLVLVPLRGRDSLTVTQAIISTVGPLPRPSPVVHSNPSSRSRGLLYLASAVCVAAAHRLDQVTVPENGQLAVNPRLTSARPSALSTRSVHPWTLALVNQIIDDIGGDVRVTNPLLHHTKGEVCALALESGLDRQTLGITFSCGNPRGKRFSGYFSCGYCYPCLLRRSGLRHAIGDDPTEYSVDLADLTADANISRDLRGLMRWLSTTFGVRDLIADSPFPADVSAPAVLPAINRGRHELRNMIEALIPTGHPPRRFWAPVTETAA